MIDVKNAIHLVYGYSALGGLRAYFNEYYPNDKIEIHAIHTDLSVGPLNDFITPAHFDEIRAYHNLVDSVCKTQIEGCDYIEIIYDDYDDDFQFPNLETQFKIDFPKDKPLIIWHGSSTGERIMLYRYCELLKGRDLYEINLDKRPLTPGYNSNSLATKNPLKDLDGIFDILNSINPEARNEYAQNWAQLKRDQKTTRILQNKKVYSVEDDFYDKAILANCTNDYQIAARVIGETMGQQKSDIGDYHLMYRLFILLNKNKIKARGNTASMQYFEVKRNE
ncbi:DUF1835 domain-containing protein [Flavobacterium sp. LS1R49]|uniref:DUF1835 domain-containing protein n=1 Tax=Flavobacterium shii TaxID=2987687 RepID=A0A9X3C4S2_9FLAO|nr:DUF1835 domain-containing protein [Flavobacterium shii]MCV9928724.1 DUF1835 domain-containing protein [Flavobacterium shii]